LGQDLVQQENAIIEEGKKLGYDEKNMIVIGKKESGISLSSDEREGIIELKNHINNDSSIDCVICWELTRIGRRPDVIYEMRDFFLERKIQWVIMTPYMRLLEEDGTMSNTSSIVFGLFTTIAESEMRIKKERFARGKKHSKELGKYTGGQVQLGYYIDKDKYIRVEEESAKIVRKIFELYSTGKYSLNRLASEMYEYGNFDNFSSKLSLCSFLHKVLKNSNYYGDNNRTPIISKELYDKCQEVFKRNYRHLKPSNKHKVLLRRLLYNKDGYCLTQQLQKGRYGKPLVLYTNGVNRGTPISVGANSIEPFVWNCLVENYSKYFMDDRKIKKKQTELYESLVVKYKTAKSRIEKFQKMIDNTETRHIYGKISEEKTNEVVGKLSKEKQEWENQKQSIVEKMRDIVERLKVTESRDIKNCTHDEKEELIHEVFERIVVERTEDKGLNVKMYSKIDYKVYEYLVYSAHGLKPTSVEKLGVGKWKDGIFIDMSKRCGLQTKIILNPVNPSKVY
jgi:DNA invertase Pin-like site-specific DNA recombinase